MTLKMTTAQVVETSVTVTNSSFQNYTHPDDHTTRTTDTPGFKPFTMLLRLVAFASIKKKNLLKEGSKSARALSAHLPHLAEKCHRTKTSEGWHSPPSFVSRRDNSWSMILAELGNVISTGHVGG